MVDIEDSGRVRSVVLNPPFSTLTYPWDCAVWRPEFTEFMHTFLLAERVELQASNLLESGRQSQPDLSVGVVVKRAVADGMNVQASCSRRKAMLISEHLTNLIAVTRKSPW
jgi:glucose-1-phosphate thymidylyltransferase